MLETPESVRNLQRKLYLKAKVEKACRFYLLYDKVHRWDVLSHAYRLVKANGGAPGIDGETFGRIEEYGEEKYLKGLQEELRKREYKASAVRRVYIPKANGGLRPLGIPTIRDRVVQMAAKHVIEPIFEADFEQHSYGFRPRKDAHQAMDAIAKHMLRGRVQVIDADLSKYFDTIPHGRLLELVARRVADRHVLNLVKQWLKAPVAEEREDGKTVWSGGKRNGRGTPQGGVISPLLANIYLHELDREWEEAKMEEKTNARLIRYADDFVVLCGGSIRKPMECVKRVIERLGLKLNEAKTRQVNAWEEGFDFLGFTVRMVRSRRSGKGYPMVRPSRKAMTRICGGIKELTDRSNSARKAGEVIAEVNQRARGWVNYFLWGHCSRDMSKLKHYLGYRVRKFLQRRRHRRGLDYRRYTDKYLHEVVGLFRVPQRAGWTLKAKAAGGS